MANGTIHWLGTLRINGKTYPQPLSPFSKGDGGDINSAYNAKDLAIVNTESGKDLSWHELILKNGKKLLICDRCIANFVSLNLLSKLNLAWGKNITIDGINYRIRVINNGGNENSYGAGCDNEWDYYISNVGERKTHWEKIYTLCSNDSIHAGGLYVARGNYNARHLQYIHRNVANEYHGWRPVLEVLNSAPNISGTDTDLGTITKEPSYSYAVSDSDNDSVTVTEKLDGKTLRSGINLGGGGGILHP